jgi:hypothetical protein
MQKQDGISLLDALLKRSGAGPKDLRRLEPPASPAPIWRQRSAAAGPIAAKSG